MALLPRRTCAAGLLRRAVREWRGGCARGRLDYLCGHVGGAVCGGCGCILLVWVELGVRLRGVGLCSELSAGGAGEVVPVDEGGGVVVRVAMGEVWVWMRDTCLLSLR